MTCIRLFFATACLLAAHAAHAAGPYTYNTAGDEVTDTGTGLVWRRCSEGQSWSASTCAGTPATYTHEAALARASSQTGWRLPNAKELASIADKSRSNPAIDTVAFPVTPNNYFWTATPYVGSPADAWLVNFLNGYVSNSYRSLTLHVRLVR